MKKAIAMLMATLLMTACSTTPAPISSSTSISEAPLSSSSSQPPASASSEQSSLTTELSPPEPVLDTELTEKINQWMLDNFGGAGNATYATSWYKYIDSFEVLKDTGGYIATLTLTENPADSTVRMMLGRMLTPKNLEYCLPAILDTGAALGLDEIDMCVIGESISKILTEEPNLSIAYASLLAYEIPVYQYLASATGLSKSDIMDNIELCTGVNAAQTVVDGMISDYGGSFKGLTIASMETAARAALVGFKDAYLSKITVVGVDGKELETYSNLVPKK